MPTKSQAERVAVIETNVKNLHERFKEDSKTIISKLDCIDKKMGNVRELAVMNKTNIENLKEGQNRKHGITGVLSLIAAAIVSFFMRGGN